jgi:hypothetical protein
MTDFWDTASCTLVEVERRCRGAYRLHHQDDKPRAKERIEKQEKGACRHHQKGDQASKHLRNVYKLLPDYTTQQKTVIFILAAVRTWNLNQMNPVHIKHYCLKYILMLSSHLRLVLASGLFSSGILTKILHSFLMSRMCYMHRPSHPPLLDHPNNMWQRIQIQIWFKLHNIQNRTASELLFHRNPIVDPNLGGIASFPHTLSSDLSVEKRESGLKIIHDGPPSRPNAVSFHSTLSCHHVVKQSTNIQTYVD